MRIEHIALWAEDIELLKEFYIRYFGAVAGNRYHNSCQRCLNIRDRTSKIRDTAMTVKT